MIFYQETNAPLKEFRRENSVTEFCKLRKYQNEYDSILKGL